LGIQSLAEIDQQYRLCNTHDIIWHHMISYDYIWLLRHCLCWHYYILLLLYIIMWKHYPNAKSCAVDVSWTICLSNFIGTSMVSWMLSLGRLGNRKPTSSYGTFLLLQFGSGLSLEIDRNRESCQKKWHPNMVLWLMFHWSLHGPLWLPIVL
jgi:hypothetical protein